MAIERTLVIIKPDAVARGLIGQVVGRLERKGLQLVACKLSALSDAKLAEHYSHLADKPFFPRIVEFMQSTPVLLQVWQGPEAVAVVRALAGPTNGRAAPAGTIRGDFSESVQCNLIHASDTPENAAAEVERFFRADEVQDYRHPLSGFVYAADEG